MVAGAASRAGGRAERRARRARRRRLRAARLLRLRPRHARLRRPRRAAGCGTATSTRPRCARRRARACSPAATTTRTAWAASPTSPPASPVTTAASRRRTRSSPRSSSRTATRRGRSASGTSRPTTKRNLAARRDRWPLGRGFERFYGFFGGETHQNAPALVYDNHFVDAPRSVEDGYHLTEDLVDHAIEFVHDLRQVDPDKPFFLYFCPGACHSPHHAPPEWIERYRGRFDAGWDAWREQTLARQIDAGLLPAAHRAVGAARVGARRGTTSTTTNAACTRATWKRSRATCRTPITTSAASSTRSPTPATSTTRSSSSCSDNGASSEGGVAGSLNDVRVWNCAPRTVEEALPDARRDRRAALAQQLSVGLDRRGQHAVPALEARGARGRRRRSADRVVAASHRRRAGPAARSATQYVHAIDIFPTVLERDRARIAGAGRRRQLRADVRATPTRPMRTRCSTTRCSAAARCTRTAGRRSCSTRSRPTSPGLDVAAWELYDVARRSVGDARPRRRGARATAGDGRPLVAGSRAQPRAAARQPAVRRLRVRPARRRCRSARRTCTGRAPAWCRRRRRSTLRDARPHDHRVRRGRRRGRADLAGLAARRLDVLQAGVARSRTCTTTRTGASTASKPTSTLGPGRTRSRSGFTKTTATGGEGELLVDGAVVATRASSKRVTPIRFSLTGVGLWCGRGGNLAVCDDYAGPFPWTGTLRPRRRRGRRARRTSTPTAKPKPHCDTQ